MPYKKIEIWVEYKEGYCGACNDHCDIRNGRSECCNAPSNEIGDMAYEP